ncbi:MAG: hypothetical protein V3V31_06565 [Methylococcales bacterium]
MIGKSGQNGLSHSRFSILGQSPSLLLQRVQQRRWPIIGLLYPSIQC